MMTRLTRLWPGFFLLVTLFAGCRLNLTEEGETIDVLRPRRSTDAVFYHAEDVAILNNPVLPDRSIILGTDIHENDGAIYSFQIDGRITSGTDGLRMPINIDVEYLPGNPQPIPVAVITDEARGRLHVYQLPEFQKLSDSGISVFGGGAASAATGVALYRRPGDGALFAIVSRRSGPTEGYLAQYRLEPSGTGVIGRLVRTFGQWSGKGEIEAVAVDERYGWIYYADETYGILKYKADPDAPEANVPLATLATEGYSGRREGIAIYTAPAGEGYLLVLEKGEPSYLHIYQRSGDPPNQHNHVELGRIPLDSPNADGLEVTSARINEQYTRGMVVVASGRAFDYYSWMDIEQRMAADREGAGVTPTSTVAARP